MRGPAGLVIVILAGFLILDVALDTWRRIDGVRRARDRQRDRDAMRRTLERRAHEHTAPGWRRR